MMMPAMANPSPLWRPADFLIWDRATKPRTMAAMKVMKKKPTMEQTNEAMARPFIEAPPAGAYTGWP